MNNDEKQLITQFFERVSGKNLAQSSSASAPNQLPPIDPEANNLINDNFRQNPEAAYRVTQMAVVQEAALVEAQNRIRQLEWQVQQMQQQIQQLHQAQQNQPSQQRSSGGFLGGFFGGGNRQQPSQSQMPPPGWGGTPNRPQQSQNMKAPYGQQPPAVNYPPGYQRGMFNRGGSGFLGSALSTAAGVAGGMMAYNALSGLFSGHHTGGGAGIAPDTTAADPFTGAGAADPFTGGGTAVDPNFDAGNHDGGAGFDNGSYDNDFGGSGGDAGWGDSGDSGWGSDDGGDWGSDGGSWGDDSF